MLGSLPCSAARKFPLLNNWDQQFSAISPPMIRTFTVKLPGIDEFACSLRAMDIGSEKQGGELLLGFFFKQERHRQSQATICVAKTKT
jgi:hypothetical protein